MKKRESILIVTDTLDSHADIIIIELRKRGYSPIRLHPADFPMNALVTLTFDQHSWNGELCFSNRKIAVDDIQSIWWRKPATSAFPDTLSSQERKIARQETRAALLGLWESIDCYWMSFPLDLERASNKIEQLQRASRLGFRVPRTIVTNDPAQVHPFYDACRGQMVYKTLTSPWWQPKESDQPTRVVYTTPITQEHLTLVGDVRTAPCLFQEYIPKRLELRVTIIGDEIFPCEIHSQQHHRTHIDWRHYDVSIPYKKGTLPPDIAEKCFAFTRSYGLNYSAMDLILTPEGEYVFLENNPNGQCLFVQEHIPEFHMAEAIAECLIRGSA